MMFETSMSGGRKMIVEVIKITTGKDIADAVFEIPKDFVVKPMKDMQSPDGRGLQIRVTGRGN